MHSTKEPSKPYLCESITSETHFWGKYLFAPNVQSLATSMLARGRSPDDWTEWFAVARDGASASTESKELILKRINVGLFEIQLASSFSSSTAFSELDWCSLIERTTNRIERHHSYQPWRTCELPRSCLNAIMHSSVLDRTTSCHQVHFTFPV